MARDGEGGGQGRCDKKKEHLREMITTVYDMTCRKISGADDAHAMIKLNSSQFKEKESIL